MSLESYSWSEVHNGLDRIMLLATIVLLLLGIVSIYSAGTSVRTSTALYALKQVLWGGVSTALYIATLRIGYQRFLRWSYWIYGLSFVMLAALLVGGTVSRGAQSWFRLGKFVDRKSVV